MMILCRLMAFLSAAEPDLAQRHLLNVAADKAAFTAVMCRDFIYFSNPTTLKPIA